MSRKKLDKIERIEPFFREIAQRSENSRLFCYSNDGWTNRSEWAKPAIASYWKNESRDCSAKKMHSTNEKPLMTDGGMPTGLYHWQTLLIDSGKGVEYFKIGKISNGDPHEQGRFDATLHFATDNASPKPRSVRMYGTVRDGSQGMQIVTHGTGQGPADNVDFVVTETNGTGKNGLNEYYLYVRANDFCVTELDIKYANASGFANGFDFQSGLTKADLVGNIVVDSAEQRNSHVEFGDVTTNELTLDGHSVFISESEPSNPSEGDLWVDTSSL